MGGWGRRRCAAARDVGNNTHILSQPRCERCEPCVAGPKSAWNFCVYARCSSATALSWCLCFHLTSLRDLVAAFARLRHLPSRAVRTTCCTSPQCNATISMQQSAQSPPAWLGKLRGRSSRTVYSSSGRNSGGSCWNRVVPCTSVRVRAGVQQLCHGLSSCPTATRAIQTSHSWCRSIIGAVSPNRLPYSHAIGANAPDSDCCSGLRTRPKRVAGTSATGASGAVDLRFFDAVFTHDAPNATRCRTCIADR